jgi:hypothetical protein
MNLFKMRFKILIYVLSFSFLIVSCGKSENEKLREELESLKIQNKY